VDNLLQLIETGLPLDVAVAMHVNNETTAKHRLTASVEPYCCFFCH